MGKGFYTPCCVLGDGRSQIRYSSGSIQWAVVMAVRNISPLGRQSPQRRQLRRGWPQLQQLELGRQQVQQPRRLPADGVKPKKSTK